MKLLFTTLTSNDLGLLTRSLPIAVSLRQRGHQVAFCNPAAAPSRLIAETGCQNLIPEHPLFYLMRGNFSPSSLYRQLRTPQMRQTFGSLGTILKQLIRAIPTRFPGISTDIWDMDHFSAMLGMCNLNFVRANYEGFTQLIQKYQPNLVVDFWNPFACLAARVTRTPLVTVIQSDLHPESRGFIWWKGPAPAMPGPTGVINTILTEHGLDPIEKVAELLVGDRTLVLGIPESDPLPPKVQVNYIGPVLWQNPDIEMPDWFEQLSTDKTVIWIYTGNPRYFAIRTPVDSEIILQACITALDTEEVQVVLTSGHHALPASCLPLPPNFYYAPFVPGLSMANRSDLLIHHGGYGSCQTGLFTGTPAVIIPTYSERESNARRVAAIGAGEFVVPTEISRWRKQICVDELKAKIQKVISEPAYQQNAQSIQRIMLRYDGVEAAVRQIETFDPA